MQQRTCLHTKLNGEPCGGVALTNKPYCYFHAKHYVRYARPTDPGYDIPIPEDSRSIILGIRQVIEFYMRGTMDRQQATTLLYGYQIAMSGVNRPDGMCPDSERRLEQRRAAELFLKLRSRAYAPAAKPKEKPEDKVKGKDKEEVKEEQDLSARLLANLHQILREEREAKGLPPVDLPPGDFQTVLESMVHPAPDAANPDAPERTLPLVSS